MAAGGVRPFAPKARRRHSHGQATRRGAQPVGSRRALILALRGRGNAPGPPPLQGGMSEGGQSPRVASRCAGLTRGYASAAPSARTPERASPLTSGCLRLTPPKPFCYDSAGRFPAQCLSRVPSVRPGGRQRTPARGEIAFLRVRFGDTPGAFRPTALRSKRRASRAKRRAFFPHDRPRRPKLT